MTHFRLCLCIGLVCLPIPAAQFTPWYVTAVEGPDSQDEPSEFKQMFAQHWTSTSFDEFLANSRSDYVLVWFYAPWCPHCRHFAPEFQRVSYAIRELNALQSSNASVRYSKEQASKASAGVSEDVSRTQVLPAMVDCVRDDKMCDFFGVRGYPTLLWGKRSDWLPTACFVEAAKRNQTECKSSASNLTNLQAGGMKAEDLGDWIMTQTSSSANLQVPTEEDWDQNGYGEKGKPTVAFVDADLASVRTKTDLWDARVAVAVWLRQIFDSRTFFRNGSGKANLLSSQDGEEYHDVPFEVLTNFIDVLSQRFPDVAPHTPCRASLRNLRDILQHNLTNVSGSAALNVANNSLSPDSGRFWINADALEEKWFLCGAHWLDYAEGWRTCRGSRGGKRGFTCGLWNTFHMLAAQSNDEMALEDLQHVRHAILHFFDCQLCRDHFAQIPAPKTQNLSRKEAQLWWWKAHNQVNARVGQSEEQAKDWDPGFPKIQWPSKAQCPACHSEAQVVEVSFLQQSQQISRLRGAKPLDRTEARGAKLSAPTGAEGDWNLDAVVQFLDGFYGDVVDSSISDDSMSGDSESGDSNDIGTESSYSEGHTAVMEKVPEHGGAGSSVRDRQNLILRYNSFLNTLDNSLRSEDTPRSTLESQYEDLMVFVFDLSKEDRLVIQQDNTDWPSDRRRELQDRCRQRGLL